MAHEAEGICLSQPLALDVILFGLCLFDSREVHLEGVYELRRLS